MEYQKVDLEVRVAKHWILFSLMKWMIKLECIWFTAFDNQKVQNRKIEAKGCRIITLKIETSVIFFSETLHFMYHFKRSLHGFFAQSLEKIQTNLIFIPFIVFFASK